MHAQAVRDMARQSRQVLVLTESEKFSKRGTVPLNLGGKLKGVITDELIGQETRLSLEQQGISVLLA